MHPVMHMRFWILLATSLLFSATHAAPGHALELSNLALQKLRGRAVLVMSSGPLKDDHEMMVHVAHAIALKREAWSLNRILTYNAWLEAEPTPRKNAFNCKWNEQQLWTLTTSEEILQLLQQDRIGLILRVGADDPHAIDLTTRFLVPTLMLSSYAYALDESVVSAPPFLHALPWTRQILLGATSELIYPASLTPLPSISNPFILEFQNSFGTPDQGLLTFISGERSLQEIFLTEILLHQLKNADHPKKFIFIAPTDFASQDMDDQRRTLCNTLPPLLLHAHAYPHLTFVRHALTDQKPWGPERICPHTEFHENSPDLEEIEVVIASGHYTQSQTWQLMAHSGDTILVSGYQEILTALWMQKTKIYHDQTGSPFSGRFGAQLAQQLSPHQLNHLTPVQIESFKEHSQELKRTLLPPPQSSWEYLQSLNDSDESDWEETTESKSTTPPEIPIFFRFDGGLKDNENQLNFLFSSATETDLPLRHRIDFLEKADFLKNNLTTEVDAVLNLKPNLLDLRNQDFLWIAKNPQTEYLLYDHTTTANYTQPENWMKILIQLGVPWASTGLQQYFTTLKDLSHLETMECLQLLPRNPESERPQEFLTLCRRKTLGL